MFQNDSALKRFFSQSVHRLIGHKLSKSIGKNDLVVKVGAGNEALHKFTNLENYIGIDTNWDMLCQLTSSFPNKKLICTSGGALPIADSAVNAFITLHTLQHIYHLAETFEEIIRILEPNSNHHFVISFEGGLPFSLGRTFITGPNLKRKYNLDIDMKLLCDVAKLGSGNSGALDRISSKALQGDFKGYVFSVNNTLKDLTYINDLLKDSNNAEELSKIAINFYSSAKDKGMGDLLVSELIEKEY